MNGHVSSASYLERLESFRRSDTERDNMVAEVIEQYRELKLQYDEKCDDYNNEIESRRLWQSKARESDAALREHRQVSVRKLLGQAHAPRMLTLPRVRIHSRSPFWMEMAL